jgi:hypothetical protein
MARRTREALAWLLRSKKSERMNKQDTQTDYTIVVLRSDPDFDFPAELEKNVEYVSRVRPAYVRPRADAFSILFHRTFDACMKDRELAETNFEDEIVRTHTQVTWTAFRDEHFRWQTAWGGVLKDDLEEVMRPRRFSFAPAEPLNYRATTSFYRVLKKLGVCLKTSAEYTTALLEADKELRLLSKHPSANVHGAHAWLAARANELPRMHTARLKIFDVK